MSGSINPMVMITDMPTAWPEVRDPITSLRRPAGGAFCIKDVLPKGTNTELLVDSDEGYSADEGS